MATAKGKRPAQNKKAPAKKGGTSARKRTPPRREPFLSGTGMGLTCLSFGIFLFFCLWSPSNAGALVAIRSFLSGALGRLHWLYVVLLCWLGLQMAFGERWPLRGRVLLYALIILFCFSTMLHLFRLDDLLLALRGEGYQESYAAFLWKSYEASKYIPVGGGYVGGLLGFPMGKYLDILGSILVLFFAIGGFALLILRQVAPTAGGQMLDWLDALRYDWAERREERSALKGEEDPSILVPIPKELMEPEEDSPPKRPVAAKGRKRTKADKAPPTPEGPPAEKGQQSSGRKRTPAPQQTVIPYPPAAAHPVDGYAGEAYPMDPYGEALPPTDDGQDAHDYGQRAPQAQQPLQAQRAVGWEMPDPMMPGKASQEALPAPRARRPLNVQDILPDGYVPTAGEYQDSDVGFERLRPQLPRGKKQMPDFLAQRRKLYDEAYGAFEDAMPAGERGPGWPLEEDGGDYPFGHVEDPQRGDAGASATRSPVEKGQPEEPAHSCIRIDGYTPGETLSSVRPAFAASEELLREELPKPPPFPFEDVPWETVSPTYAPAQEEPKPTRRRKNWTENPLDYLPKLDPEMRLDRPDWKPPAPDPIVEAVPDEEAYRQPPFSLLEREDSRLHRDTRAQDEAGAEKLESTLASFGVEARVIKVVHGPAITRYELQPAPGVKVSKIVGLTDDIALNMAAIGVRIEAPIPGKAAIGIELANEEIETVHLRDVLESDESLRHVSRLAVALGKDIAGKRIIADLARMPHLLIAGATGSGKSVCINTLITSIIYRATPEEVRLILIDPKKVELSVYNGIPHLLVPVVTDAKKANGALSWAVMEMDERYKRFAEIGVRDIRGYNSKRSQDAPFMPQIVVIIDELSDLMLVAPGEVEESICRIAQLARACGIHLVVATQRPSVNVITGIIKANIPSRIAFAVSSQVDSRTILDSAGAEKLLGKGDMLYAPAGGGKPIRVQGCFVSDGEVARVAEYVKDRHNTEYSQAVIEALDAQAEAENAREEDAGEEGLDPLFEQAVETVIESGQASISMLQRRLRIGYARAGRLVDDMARHNIVGPADGSKSREVLITREDMALLFARREG